MKKFLFFLFLLLLLAAAYLAGQRGTDPTQWFAPPTPTPTFTATATSTATDTATATATATPPPAPTATPVPKKKTVKKTAPPKKKQASVPTPKRPEPPLPPESKPICNSAALPSAVSEAEPNNIFDAAQDLGTLTTAGLQVNGFLSKVGVDGDGTTGDTFKNDLRVDTSPVDNDVYKFTANSNFLVVLDCYTNVVGKPKPIYNDDDYQLEVYDASFTQIGSSIHDDPIESVEVSTPGTVFYIAVYGFGGKNGKYRVTVTRKD